MPASVFVLLVALGASPPPPSLLNGRLESRSTEGSLGALFPHLLREKASSFWIGYGVPLEGRGPGCCDSPSSRGCCPQEAREGDGPARRRGPVHLEGPRNLMVLFRVEDGRVGAIRALSDHCALDAGGRTLLWLTDVTPGESLTLLESFLRGERRLSEGALGAVAFHAGPEADGVLERLVGKGEGEPLRKTAAFWMGSARGRRGFEDLRGLAETDPSPSFRKEVVFALSESPIPEALPTLIRVAHRDASPAVRSQALFWLAQKAGRDAERAITDAIRDDPETEVKRKAVFALAQLPTDQGVPLLISTARRNPNPEVRKQAFFWLGQTSDPRALAFFEEILAP
jgi:hypothetical protein